MKWKFEAGGLALGLADTPFWHIELPTRTSTFAAHIPLPHRLWHWAASVGNDTGAGMFYEHTCLTPLRRTYLDIESGTDARAAPSPFSLSLIVLQPSCMHLTAHGNNLPGVCATISGPRGWWLVACVGGAEWS